MRQYTINLAPAELPKEGAIFDLAIAVGILSTTNQLDVPENALFIGELSLTGEVKAIKGVLAICQLCSMNQIKHIVLPKKNMAEASLIKGLNLLPIEHSNLAASSSSPLWLFVPESRTSSGWFEVPLESDPIFLRPK